MTLTQTARAQAAHALTWPLRRLRKHTGYGWSCPPCRIWTGDPTNPFATETDAATGLTKHLHDSHGDTTPDGAETYEITWRG